MMKNRLHVLALLLTVAMDAAVARILTQRDGPDTEAAEPVVPRFVLGYAVCDSCWENRVTTNTIFLPNVSTVFECTDPKDRVVFRQTSTTDRLGSFLVELPLGVAQSVALLSTCISRVIKGPVRHRPCGRFSSVRSASPFLSLQPLPDGRLIYGTGPIFFKPRQMHPFCSSPRTQTLPFSGNRPSPSSNASVSQPSVSSSSSSSTPSTTPCTPSVSSPSTTISSNGFQISLSLQISSPGTTSATHPAAKPSTPASASSNSTNITVNPTISNFTFPSVPTFTFPMPFIPSFPQVPPIPPLPPFLGFPRPALPPSTAPAIPAAVPGPAPQHQRQL